MMVSPWIREVLLYGSLAAVAASLFVFYARGPAAQRRRLVRIAPWLGLFGGLVAAVYVWMNSTKMVVVTDDGAGVSARRMVKIGPAPDNPAKHGDLMDTLAPDVWVVNDSTHVVRVETVQYGQALFDNDPIVIPPGAMKNFVTIDNIGPDDPPPSSVKDEYNLHMDMRDWLTWDLP